MTAIGLHESSMRYDAAQARRTATPSYFPETGFGAKVFGGFFQKSDRFLDRLTFKAPERNCPPSLFRRAARVRTTARFAL
jgi:hypothetical protein